MHNRRVETRLLCADLVDVQWKDKSGRTRRAIANLEDISMSGACVQVDLPVPLNTVLRISYPKGNLQGKVCYCVYREIGYFLGVEFEPGFRWSLRSFRPQHLLDPRRLVSRVAARLLRQPVTPVLQ
ncbi:MAG: PilZ domain-containing protein [Acidobacteria bacterium]|nr:PilZ domain-containing protein [Acidobacteriota bacterium]MBI3278993.1 PilZ domain-containing protein [Acidobacteriota bacterium]